MCIRDSKTAIKIMKPQAFPIRIVIAAALDVKMQFVFISGTITALIQALFMTAILESYKWHPIKKSANGNIVYSDCLCNTLSKNVCIYTFHTKSSEIALQSQLVNIIIPQLANPYKSSVF